VLSTTTGEISDDPNSTCTSLSCDGNSSSRLRLLQKTDVDWLLGTLGREDLEEFEQPWFAEDCRRKFRLLDIHHHGFLSVEELGSASFTEMFPTLQLDLVDGDRRIHPLTTSIPSLIAALDRDGDGCISEEEFPELVKFCQAWRVRQYYSTGQMLGRKSYRPPAMPKKPVAAPSGRPAARGALTALHVRPLSRQSSESRTSAASRQSSVSVDSSSASRPPSEPHQSFDQLGQGLTDVPVERLGDKKRRGRSRSGSLAASRPSSRGSSKSSDGRGRSKTSRDCVDHEALQLEAFHALIEHVLSFSRSMPLGDVVYSLVQHVMTRENTTAFARDDVNRAANRAQTRMDTSLEPEEFRRTDAAEGALVARHLAGCVPSAAGRSGRSGRRHAAWPTTGQQTRGAGSTSRSSTPPGSRPSSGGQRPESREVCEVTPGAVVQVLNVLVEYSGMTMSDILGQVLFRHRRTEPLQLSQHRATAEDTSWIDGFEDIREVYRSCTRKDHGRMRRSQWLKIVQLIQRNPVLRTKVRQSDADRLFYSMTTRNKDPNRTINVNEFLQLLLMLVETCGLHPWMIFFSVGSHAEHLAAQAQAGWD